MQDQKMMGLPPKPKDGKRRNNESFMSPQKTRNPLKLLLSPMGSKGNRTPVKKNDGTRRYYEEQIGGFPRNIDLDYDDDDDDSRDANNNSGEVKFMSPVQRLSTAMRRSLDKLASPMSSTNKLNSDGDAYDDEDDDDDRQPKSEDGHDMDGTLLLLCRELELIGDDE